MHATRGIIVFIMGVLLLPLLAGCSDDKEIQNPALLPVQAVPVDPDPVGWRLAQAAEKASGAMHKMAQIEAFRTPMPIDQGVNTNIPGMNQVTSLTWTGPIDQVTRTLSEMAGLQFRIGGKAPPLPLVVSVDAHQQPIGQILRDIGLQAGRRADIIINTTTKTLDLRYAPSDGLNYY